MANILLGLALREVYRDPGDRSPGGGLLHRRFTLTDVAIGGLLFCDTSLSGPFLLIAEDYSSLPALENQGNRSLERHAAR